MALTAPPIAVPRVTAPPITVPRLPALALILALVACGRTDADDAAGERPGAPAHVRIAGDTVFVDSASAELIGLEVRVPPHHAVGEWIETTGQIAADPAGRSAVSAPAEGRIESISVVPGDQVARGQTVVRFTSPEYLSGAIELRAPRAGLVTARLADVGAVVQPGASILEISDLDRVILLVDVFPEMLGEVHVGMAVEAEVPGDSLALRGSISAIDAQVDSLTQAARARVPLQNPQGRLRPGTFLHARVLAREGEEAILVPSTAVVRDSVHQWVYAPARDGYERRAVKARAAPGDSMAVMSGIEPGQPVVVRGAYQLHQARFSFRGLTTFGEEGGEAGE
jgi:multidrug efflux pump subunit AcrA (membrane-fusion protein)